MGINLGSGAISKLYLGNTEINKAYLGSTLVWDTGTSPSFLLDTYTGASVAYSLRQLKTGVTHVIRVRRSSDNAEANFTAAEITNGTLTTWVGAGNNGFITTWYDQSGNGVNATNSITAGQQRIVVNGSVYTINGKPAAKVVNNSSLNQVYFLSSAVNAQMVTFVVKRVLTSTINYVIGNSSPAIGVFLGGSFSGINGLGFFDGTNARSTSVGEDTNQNMCSFYTKNTNNAFFKLNNGSELNPGSLNGASFNFNQLWGRASNDIVFAGDAQELITFSTDYSGNITTIHDLNNDYYAIY